MLKRMAFTVLVALTIAAAAPDKGIGNSEPDARPLRSALQPPSSPACRACSLYIRTDPTVWTHIRRQFPYHKDLSELSKINAKIRRQIISIISDHVSALNYIYGGINFDGRLEHRNITFEVQRIKIDSLNSCDPNSWEPSEYCAELSARDLLERHSLENHEDFCLAYLFTFRNFQGGISGLSWSASSSDATGGVCEKYKTYTEVKDGKYLSQKRSLNTGVFSLANYNTRVPARVSHLNLAQLIGHNFGSSHDDLECQPGGRGDNFIMFRGATAGDRPNNGRFSPCSVRDISAVLDSLDAGLKRNCFTRSSGSFCGNKIVEPGEECDCGFDDKECEDRCCYPRQVNAYNREKNSTAKGCARKAHTQCSPSQGPCCNGGTCLLTAAHTNTTCREATECSRASYCAGRAECPRPAPEPAPAACNHGTQMCMNGECEGSKCLAWNMTQCFLTETKPAVVEATTEANDSTPKLVQSACALACRAGPAGPCRGAAELAPAPADGLSLPPGSPCHQFQGYCDESARCQPVSFVRAGVSTEGSPRVPPAAPPATAPSYSSMLQSITKYFQKLQSITKYFKESD